MSEKQAVSPALTREQLEAAISAQSWQDENFLAELRRDPKGTLEKEQGITLPANLEIRLVEETQNVVYLRLQANPEELSDEMMDQVAGGSGWPGAENIISNKFESGEAFAHFMENLRRQRDGI